MSWIAFAAVLGAFFLTHSVPVRPAIRARLVDVLGANGFIIAYLLLSIFMLAWLITAAADAPYVSLWDQALWQRTVTFYGMLAVCLLVALAAARPNPFSLGGFHNERFDPAYPGLVRWSRHPLLLALAIWAGVHILPNGDLAHAILFGVFAEFSILGMKLIDRRKMRLLGQEKWLALKHQVSAAPMWATPQSWAVLGLRIAAGGLGFLLLVLLHPTVLGVSPMP